MSVTIQFDATNNPAITSLNLYEGLTPTGAWTMVASYVITPTSTSVIYPAGVVTRYYYVTFVNTLAQESLPSPVVPGSGGKIDVSGDIVGYSTVEEVDYIIASALTQGTADPNFGATPVPLINMGKLPTTTVKRDIIVQYIKNADTIIDGYLSTVYDIPLKRIVRQEQPLIDNATSGSNLLKFADTSKILVGDKILLMDTLGHNYIDILLVLDATSVQIKGTLSRNYLISNGAKVQYLRYPDPIQLTSARLAAGNLYDKYFAAQQSPDMSNYGVAFRKLAYSNLNGIINGRNILIGQRRTGRRFYNPELLNVQVTSAPEKGIDLPG
jgi:hypothetical protein